MKSRLILSCCFALSQACTTVNSISISQIPAKKNRGTIIHSEGGAPVILGIPFGNHFLDEAMQDLLDQCPAPAKIAGVMTKHQNKVYLGWLIGYQQLSMQGYCMKQKG